MPHLTLCASLWLCLCVRVWKREGSVNVKKNLTAKKREEKETGKKRDSIRNNEKYKWAVVTDAIMKLSCVIRRIRHVTVTCHIHKNIYRWKKKKIREIVKLSILPGDAKNYWVYKQTFQSLWPSGLKCQLKKRSTKKTLCFSGRNEQATL